MSKVHIKINNMPLEVEGGTLLIDAARQLGIDIPHMCYHHDQESKAHCRLCVVEVKGQRKLQTSCTTPVSEGMEVFTDTQKVYDAQVGILELMLADHKQNCLSCARSGNC